MKTVDTKKSQFEKDVEAGAKLLAQRGVKENAVKAALRAYLKEIGAYQYWPVPMGYGASTVDVLVCYKGKFFAIETKRPGVSKPTVAQSCVMRAVGEAGGGVILENSVDLEMTKRCLYYR